MNKSKKLVLINISCFLILLLSLSSSFNLPAMDSECSCCFGEEEKGMMILPYCYHDGQVRFLFAYDSKNRAWEGFGAKARSKNNNRRLRRSSNRMSLEKLVARCAEYGTRGLAESGDLMNCFSASMGRPFWRFGMDYGLSVFNRETGYRLFFVKVAYNDLNCIKRLLGRVWAKFTGFAWVKAIDLKLGLQNLKYTIQQGGGDATCSVNACEGWIVRGSSFASINEIFFKEYFTKELLLADEDLVEQPSVLARIISQENKDNR